MISQALIGRQYSDKESIDTDIRRFAQKNGFGVTRSFNNTNGTVYFYCRHRYGYKNNVDPEKRIRVGRTSKLTETCSWKVYAKKVEEEWRISKINLHGGLVIDASNVNQFNMESIEEHGHPTITNAFITASIIPSARRLGDESKKTIVSMLDSGVEPSKIVATMRKDKEIITTAKDVYNIKQRMGKEENDNSSQDEKLVKKLNRMEEDGFFIDVKVGKSGAFRAILIMHHQAVDFTRRFGEVLLVDATYNTNDLKLPLVNIVGFTNLGKDRLTTFVAATILMVSEVKSNYAWALETFKNAVWGKNDINTKIIVTDQDVALEKAIETTFPECHHMLCVWHISNNFRKNYEGSFRNENGQHDKGKEVKCRSVINMLFYDKDKDNFVNNTKVLLSTFDLSLNNIKLRKQLDQLLSIKHKWGGPWCETVRHYGTRTTQRAESAHSSLKTMLARKMSVGSLAGKVGQWLTDQFREQRIRFEFEMESSPVNLYEEKYFKDIVGKISHFALNLLYNEYRKRDTVGEESECNCAARSSYGLLCKHTLPGVLIADDIDMFWHLKKEEIGSSHITLETGLIVDHEAAMDNIRSLLEKLPTSALNEVVSKVSVIVQNIIDDSGPKEVMPSVSRQLILPQNIKPKGRPTKKQKQIRKSVVDRINDSENKNDDKLSLARWESNSCYIDCVIEIVLRIILPNVLPYDADEKGISYFISILKKYSEKEQFVLGTKFAREYLWENGFEKHNLSDCQLVYHAITDDGPLQEYFSVIFNDHRSIKAFEVIRKKDDEPVGILFNKDKYRQGEVLFPASFLTINDAIISQSNEDQYDYPESVVIDYNYYEICGRILAQSAIGGHFYSYMNVDGKKYIADNMAGRMKNINGKKIHGKVVNTIYVFYKLVEYPAPNYTKSSPSSRSLSSYPSKSASPPPRSTRLSTSPHLSPPPPSSPTSIQESSFSYVSPLRSSPSSTVPSPQLSFSPLIRSLSSFKRVPSPPPRSTHLSVSPHLSSSSPHLSCPSPHLSSPSPHLSSPSPHLSSPSPSSPMLSESPFSYVSPLSSSPSSPVTPRTATAKKIRLILRAPKRKRENKKEEFRKKRK